VDRYVLMLIEHKTGGRRARELMYVTEIVIMYTGVCVCGSHLTQPLCAFVE